MNIYLEIFGYVGTALVLLSMMMTSLKALRAVNIAGSVISMTYAALSETYPVVLLNAGLILVNSWQLFLLFRRRPHYRCAILSPEDARVKRFLMRYGKDVERFFPGYAEGHERWQAAYLVFEEEEAVGLLLGREESGELITLVDYACPRRRDRSVAEFLYTFLAREGFHSLVCAPGAVPRHRRYLSRMGFLTYGDTMVKALYARGN